MLDENDKKHAENLLRALRKCSFENLLGVEVLALSDAYQWLAAMISKGQEMKAIEKPLDLKEDSSG